MRKPKRIPAPTYAVGTVCTVTNREAAKQAASKLDATRHSTIIKYGTDQEVETGRKSKSTQALSGYPNQGISASPEGHGLQTRITRSTK